MAEDHEGTPHRSRIMKWCFHDY